MTQPSQCARRFRFDHPRSRKDISLAVVSDAHVTPARKGTWKVLHRSVERLSSALQAAERRGIDAVLVPGDLTRDGTPEEFDAVNRLVSGIDVPVLSVPGNHDPAPAYSANSPVPAPNWREVPSATPFCHSVGDVDVIGLDSATAATGSDGGVVGPEQRAWLDGTLAEADQPIVVIHHPLGIDWTGLKTVFRPGKFHVADATELRERLAPTDALVVAGHVHWPIAERNGDLREVVAPATCSYPQAIYFLKIGNEGTVVELQAISTESDRREALEHLRDDPVLGGAYVDMVRRADGDSRPGIWVTAEETDAGSR